MDTSRTGRPSNTFVAGISRRAAFGRLAAGGIGAALWTAVERGSASSQAQATPEAQCVEPNLFQFVGEETQITYNALTGNLTMRIRAHWEFDARNAVSGNNLWVILAWRAAPQAHGQ